MSGWVSGKEQSSEIDAQMCRQLAFHKGTETILWGQEHCFNSPQGTGYLYEEWKLQTPTSLYIKSQFGLVAGWKESCNSTDNKNVRISNFVTSGGKDVL